MDKKKRRRGNNEGSISQYADGRWCGRYFVELPDGRKKRKALYGNSRKEVTNKLAQALAKRDDGVLFDDEGQSLGEYIEWWLTTSKRGRVKATTYESHAREVRKHIIPGLGRIRLKSPSPAHLQSYYSFKCESGLAPRTVQYHHTLLHQALKNAVKWGYVRRNVAAVVDPPKVEKKEINPLSAAQVKALLEAAKGDRLEAFYLLAVSTGMRQGELQALKWTDIDLRERTLSGNRTLSAVNGGPVFTPPKTSKSRRKIFLSRKSVEALRRHRENQETEKEAVADRWHDDDLVFCSSVGTPLSRHNVRSRSFKPLLRRAELPAIRFHELRHTCATLLLSKNIHPKLVQELLGHASISTTLDTYSHVLCGMSRGVADAMDNILR
jgi:integrase